MKNEEADEESDRLEKSITSMALAVVPLVRLLVY